MQEVKRRSSRPPECGACYARLFTSNLDQQFFIVANFSPNLREHAKGLIIEQQRVGIDGKPFGMFKIKTMRDNVPATEFANRADILTSNPRITKTGKFLRKFWLDELPQAVNFARGQLKLIGPRALPLATSHVLPKRFVDRRSKMKPGLISISHADPHSSIEEMISKERIYLYRHARAPFRTDAFYLLKFLYQVAAKGKRGQ